MRYAPLLAVSVALVVAACAATPVGPAVSPGVPVAPASAAPASTAPEPTPVPVGPTLAPIGSPVVTPPTAAAATTPATSAVPDEGNVDSTSYPELTVTLSGTDTLRIRLDDPTAKAWRLDIAGTGALATDRFVIEVETGDVAPAITATEIRGGRVVDEMNLSGYLDGTAAAGGCHATLRVCVDSDGFRLPRNGDGRFALRLFVGDATGPLTITGSTAGWPGEPFVLGRWVATEPFPWSPA